MKRSFVLALILMLLISACTTQPSTESTESQTLKVSDGTTVRSYTVDELKSMGSSEATFRDVTYIGVQLSILLKEAGFDPNNLKAVKAVAVDGFSANYEPDLVNKTDTLVAYAQVDGALLEDEGTFRMVLPDQEGKLNVRQLVELQIIP